MGLLKILRKIKQRERELRILILGLDNSGKTTTVRQFNGEVDLDRIGPTIGFNIITLNYKQFRLNFWDIGGQQTIRSYWRNYFEQTDGVIWVIDSVDRRRIAQCAAELHALLKEERLLGSPVLILANKQDLSSAMTVQELAEHLQLHQMTTSRRWSIVPCSAITGDGLEQGISWIVDEIYTGNFISD